MLAERSHLSASQGMRSRRAVLNATDVQRSCSEVDLFPAKIADFRCSQPMPEGKQHHEPIALTLPVRGSDLD
jgi:hypothetical protein